MKVQFFSVLLTFFVLGASGAVQETVLIHNGVSKARIELPGMEPPPEDDIFSVGRVKFAERLAFYLEKSTGVRLPVGKGSDAGSTARILLKTESGTMDPEGFRIEFPDERTISITGGSLRGLEYGVSDFLERYVGVRWLFPGELGTEIPHRTSISVPRKEIISAPSFRRRFLAGGSHRDAVSAVYYHWMVANRGDFHKRMNTSHNLWALIPPKIYEESHPEFYPVKNGKRYFPKEGEVIWYQPCLTAPGIVEAALSRIPKDAKVLSLTVNDGGRHCECARCLARDGSAKNYLGLPDRSGSYLDFCIAVAKKRPGTLFGFSAYSDVAEPPKGMKLPSNLVPEITQETLYWLDPERRTFSFELLDRWNQTASGPLGWYDYLYGGCYALPRITPRLAAENLKILYSRNVRYLSGEYFPEGNWQDAVKIYVWLKTAWDVGTDPEALIDDWCRTAVGPKAAEPLKKYFERIEQFWRSEALQKTPYFSRFATYLNWGDATFLDAMPESMVAECEALLNETVEKSENTPRAEYFRNEFLKLKSKLLLYKKNQNLREKTASLHFDCPVFNNDFNVPGSSWGTWKEAAAKGRFFRDETGGCGGTSAIAIDASGSQRLGMCYMTYVPAQRGKLYRVSAWTSFHQMDVGAKISFDVRWIKDGKWLDSGFNRSEVRTATEQPGEWEKTVIPIYAPDDDGLTMVLLFGIGQSAAGVARLDDVSVETVNYTEAELRDWQSLKFDTVIFRENFNSPNIVWVRSGNTSDLSRRENSGIDNSPCLEVAKGSFLNFIPVPGGKKLRFRGKYRGGEPVVTVKFQDSKPSWLSESFTLSSCFPASDQWTEFVVYVNSPTVEGLKIVPFLSKTTNSSAVLFDDIEIATESPR